MEESPREATRGGAVFSTFRPHHETSFPHVGLGTYRSFLLPLHVCGLYVRSPLASRSHSLTSSCADTVLFGDLVAYAHIFEPYNLSDGVLGLTFLPIAVGLLICGACTPLIFRQYKKEARNAASRGQPLHPEHHLKIAMVGTWLVPISLFWGAWSSYGDVPGSIWSVLLSQVLFGTGILSIFIASYQYIIVSLRVLYFPPMLLKLIDRSQDAYLSTAASALATLTFVRYPISGGAVMFTPAMYNNLGMLSPPCSTTIRD